MTCMSGVPLSVEEVDTALKESRGSSGPPLTDLGGVCESDLLRVRATVERVNRLIDRVAELKAALEGLRYPPRDGEEVRFCDHAAAPCDRCSAAATALGLQSEAA